MAEETLRASIRRIVAVCVLVTGVLALPGCLVLSLSPLYDDASIEYEPGLVGTWEDAEEDVSVEVGRGEWRSYAVIWRAPGATGRATARLTKVAGEWYVDLMPVAGEERGPLLVPVHGFCRVRLAGDALSIEALSHEWMSTRAARGELPRVAHDERDNLLLTASTASLRTWLARNQKQAALFDEVLTLKRRLPSTTQSGEDGPARAPPSLCGASPGDPLPEGRLRRQRAPACPLTTERRGEG